MRFDDFDKEIIKTLKAQGMPDRPIRIVAMENPEYPNYKLEFLGVVTDDLPDEMEHARQSRQSPVITVRTRPVMPDGSPAAGAFLSVHDPEGKWLGVWLARLYLKESDMVFAHDIWNPSAGWRRFMHMPADVRPETMKLVRQLITGFRFLQLAVSGRTRGDAFSEYEFREFCFRTIPLIVAAGKKFNPSNVGKYGIGKDGKKQKLDRRTVSKYKEKYREVWNEATEKYDQLRREKLE